MLPNINTIQKTVQMLTEAQTHESPSTTVGFPLDLGKGAARGLTVRATALAPGKPEQTSTIDALEPAKRRVKACINAAVATALCPPA